MNNKGSILVVILVTSYILSICNASGYTGSCDKKIDILQDKLDRVLYILESTFKIGDTSDYYSSPKGNVLFNQGSKPRKEVIYGSPIPNSGRINEAAKQFGSISDAEIRGAAHIDTETEVKRDGYDEKEAFLSKDAFRDDAAALEAYGKKEEYLNDFEDGNVFVTEVSGTRINDSIAALRRNVVREEQTITEDFVNDATKENHVGSYKGNEFDVGFKSKQLNGGFNDLNTQTDAEQSRFFNAENQGDVFENGRDFSKEKKSYDDEEYDVRARERTTFRPGTDGKEYYPDDQQRLYDKYTGKSSKQPIGDSKFAGIEAGNGKYAGDGKYAGIGPNIGRKRTDYDLDKDLDTKTRENEFGIKDKFGNSIAKEDNIGVSNKLNSKTQFNNGKYTDVDASGFNKQANYAGDYKTNKEARKTRYAFTNDESVEEIGTPDRFASAVINDNRVEFRGKDVKRNINRDRKQGKYTDNEFRNKEDTRAKAQKYKDNEFFNKRKQENEADLFFEKERGRDVNKDKYRSDYRNDGYQSKQKPRHSRTNFGNKK